MAYTYVNKPTGAPYAYPNFAGTQTYDQSDITYDQSTVLYDSINDAAYTYVPDPGTLGAELVTNGSFTGSAAGWVFGNHGGLTWTYVSNHVNVAGTAGPGSFPDLTQSGFTFVQNATYRISVTIANLTNLGFAVTLGGTDVMTINQNGVSTSDVALNFLPVGGDLVLHSTHRVGVCNADVDDISLRRIDDTYTYVAKPI